MRHAGFIGTNDHRSLKSIIIFLIAVIKRIVRVGYYRMTGCCLGKGHFGRVEEAIHTGLNVKVRFLLLKFLYRFINIVSKLFYEFTAGSIAFLF